MFLCLGLLASASPSVAQGGSTFFVTSVDAGQFPQIQFELRAVDLNNQVVTNLNSANVSVYENGQLVPKIELTPRTDGPLNLIFVIDQGSINNYQAFGLNNLRQAITTLITGSFFTDGKDTVQVLGRQNINSDQTVTLLPATHLGSDVTTWAANFNFARGSGPTKGLLGVDEAINTMAQLVPVPGSQTAAIILVTRYIQDPNVQVATTAAQNTAATAKQKYISVYVFHTDKSNQQPLQALASGATGQYIALERTTVPTLVSAVYQALNAQRVVYTVSYRSALSDSGVRHITINSAEAPTAGVAGSYEATVLPPTVSLTQPTLNTTIQRTATRDSDGVLTYDNNELKVTADITWPEKTQPRAIQSAELYLDGVLQPTSDSELSDSSVQLTWDLSKLIEPGQRSAKLELRVKDELNVEAIGETTINLDIPTPPPTGPSQTTLLLIGGVLLLACCGLGLVVIVIGVIAFVRRPVETREQAQKIMSDVQNTMIVAPSQEKGAAVLKVLEGPPGLIGETFPLSKPVTIIGRNPQAAHIVFYPTDATSVSRVHCTIRLAGKYIILTDNNSSNGTRINGKQVKPNEPVQLRDGDEILLGDLAKLGVKLKLSLVSEQPAKPAPEEGLDRTFILDDWDKDNPDQFEEDK